MSSIDKKRRMRKRRLLSGQTAAAMEAAEERRKRLPNARRRYDGQTECPTCHDSVPIMADKSGRYIIEHDHGYKGRFGLCPGSYKDMKQS